MKIKRPPQIQHQNRKTSNSLSGTMNIVHKKKINKTFIKAKALTTNNSTYFSKSPFKTKQLTTLSKSNIMRNTTNLRLKKKTNNKLNILFEIESKVLLIQKNIRRYLAQVKYEKLKVTKLIQGDINDNNDIDFMFSFKNENSIDYSNTSIDNYISKNSLTKNKSANLLRTKVASPINDSLNSVRSDVSRVSINSSDYDYSDEDYNYDDI